MGHGGVPLFVAAGVTRAACLSISVTPAHKVKLPDVITACWS